jgi:hypothetical protein
MRSISLVALACFALLPGCASASPARSPTNVATTDCGRLLPTVKREALVAELLSGPFVEMSWRGLRKVVERLQRWATEADATEVTDPAIAAKVRAGAAMFRTQATVVEKVIDALDQGDPPAEAPFAAARSEGARGGAWVSTMPSSCPDEPPRSALDAKLIPRAVREKADAFRRCYERELLYEPTLGGRIVVHFWIDLDGSVPWAWTEGGVPRPSGRASLAQLVTRDATRCVLATASSLTFPPPEGNVVTVAYPITFSPIP